jgi:hypothetical protein
MKRIPLTKGKEALVDDEDYEYLMQWKWYYHGHYAGRNLPRANGKQRNIFMHPVIAGLLGLHKGHLDIDHADGNKLNNQRANLRIATRSQNKGNGVRYVTNTTGFKGVTQFRDKWMARIQLDGKRVYLKCWGTPKEAALAYNEAASRYFGQFARLNTL